ncbi:Acetyl-CoA synthetase-like protein [Mycena kentingensis (nom. inval.)]|nr:Acetyl-CoA synthetase-like protein [Mycena kentingensis (nom. inval.)]
MPPIDSHTTLRDILDFHLDSAATRPAYVFAEADQPRYTISFEELAQAAHRAARLLRPQPMEDGGKPEVVAIVALADVLLYQTIIAGCLDAGLVPFPISQRNSEAAILHLLQATGCHRILTTRGSLGSTIDKVLREAAEAKPKYELHVDEIPLLLTMSMPSCATFGHVARFPSMPSRCISTRVVRGLPTIPYIHNPLTSLAGSTGLPKPIPQSHRHLIQWATTGCVRELITLSPLHAVGALPSMHVTGAVMQLIFSLCTSSSVAIYPPAALRAPGEYCPPPVATAQNALENARRAGATGITAVPSFIVEWAQDPGAVEYLKTLNVVIYAGGTLPTRIGDALVGAGVRIGSIYGSTEIGSPTTLERTPEEAKEWSWIKFNDTAKVHWGPQGDGTFECQILTDETHFLPVENIPGGGGYATSDLFERHPRFSHLYRVVGRVDDLIVLATGEKVSPAPLEDVISASPFVAGAVVFGRERDFVGVLVEPTAQYMRDATHIISGQIAPAYGRIFKEAILCTSPDRAMLRTPKGTISKKATLALYAADIVELYTTIDNGTTSDSIAAAPSAWSVPALEDWLLCQLAEFIGTVAAHADIFDHGFDSLHETILRHRILAALRMQGRSSLALPINFVYAHPTIREMARALAALVRGDSELEHAGSRVDAIEAMIAKYSVGFEVPLSVKVGGKVNILLTGSTGGLGSQTLGMLLRSARVGKVYAFNRVGTVPVLERQRRAFVDHGLELSLLQSSKLEFVEGDAAARDGLGVSNELYHKLRDTVDVIIHNAWPLNFNTTLTTFEPQIQGTRNLIELARVGGMRFLFTSSVSSALGWDVKSGPVPEEVLLDANNAVGIGYGESKYVAERLLRASGIPFTIFRIGQVCGSAKTGTWATSDWVPALIKSSIALGCFPSLPDAEVAWIRPESVCGAIVGVALAGAAEPVLNVVHPKPVGWDWVMTELARKFNADAEHGLPLVPMADWVAQMEKHSAETDPEIFQRIPGLKLLGFFAEMGSGNMDLKFNTARAECCPELGTEPLCGEDIEKSIPTFLRLSQTSMSTEFNDSSHSVHATSFEHLKSPPASSESQWLPPDVLGEIAAQNVDSNGLVVPPWNMSKVCATWRSALIGHALLWTNLTAKNVERLQLQLERCAGAQLSVRVTAHVTSGEDLILCLATLMERSKRFNRLFFDGPWSLSVSGLAIIMRAYGKLENLTELVVNALDVDWDEDIFTDLFLSAPNLRRVSIRYIKIQVPRDRITHYAGVHANAPPLLQMLQHASNLHDISPTTFPHLESLWIPRYHRNLLDALTTPALRSLLVDPTTLRHCTALMQRSRAPLRNLILDFSVEDADTIYHVDEVLSLFRLCPDLDYLFMYRRSTNSYPSSVRSLSRTTMPSERKYSAPSSRMHDESDATEIALRAQAAATVRRDYADGFSAMIASRVGDNISINALGTRLRGLRVSARDGALKSVVRDAVQKRVDARVIPQDEMMKEMCSWRGFPADWPLWNCPDLGMEESDSDPDFEQDV